MAAAFALAPAGTALAGTHRSSSWALPQIRVVTGAGLMGTKSPATFRPNETVTAQALADLVFGLKQLLAPPPAPAPPAATTTQSTVTAPTTTSTDPTQTPNDPATRAEAAYSAAQILHSSGWLAPVVQNLADTFALPAYTPWQRRIIDTAVARIGMPYVWGGTSDGSEVDFGVPARGGYDCSGFVWRVYKLTKYSGEGSLASVIRGRTTYVMSAEVPKSELIGFADLQPADLVFFGAHGSRSKPSEVDHVGVYVGNAWCLNSWEYAVARAQLTGRTRPPR